LDEPRRDRQLHLGRRRPDPRHIAGFLDRETAKIDASERLIELLQEMRAALITSAVTKGSIRKLL
jgi:hypothetical protein